MIKAEKINRYKYYYAFMDFLILAISFVFTVFAMAGLNNLSADRLFTPVFPLVILLFMLSILLIFEFNHLYTFDVIRSRTKQLLAVIKSLAAGSIYIFLTVMLIMSVDFTEVGILLLAFSATAFSLFYIVRIEVLRNVVLQERSMGKKLLIIGDGIGGKKITEHLYRNENTGINLIGILDNYHNTGEEIISGVKVLGHLDKLESIPGVDEVIISYDDLSYNELFEISDKCIELGINTSIASDLVKIIADNFKTGGYAGVPIVEISPNRTSPEMKRLLDVILSILGIIVLMPVFIVLAVIVKLTSKGPVLYKQKRVGLNGNLFEFYKFRSMIVSDDDDPERKELMLKFIKKGFQKDKITKIVNEKRITLVGAFLRKYSLDELPQLINVLKGDMSLVGPRPSLPYEYESYEPWQRKRVQMLPGCTGIWQVKGRSQVSFDESVLLDLYYRNRVSPIFDLMLILKTIPVMILAKGGR